MGCCLLLAACKSERTVYDDTGNVVKERKAGEFSSLEDRFAGGFDAKKNEQGIVEAESRKVSSFQGKLDASRSQEDSYQGKSFGGGSNESSFGGKGYSGATARFAGSKEYKDSSKSAYSTDDIPDFMKAGKGITKTEYKDNTRDLVDQGKTYNVGEAYEKEMSRTNRDDESSYFESHRDSSPAPPIYSKSEYSRKTLQDTRSLLKRDNTVYTDN